MEDPTPTVCSSPGKVLVSGGYLILERPYTGTVLALDARFRSLVQLCAVSSKDQALAGDAFVIDVHSPQFRDHRRYAFRRLATGVQLDPVPLAEGSPLPRANRYVELPLLYSLSLLCALLGDDFVERTVAATRQAGWDCTHSPGLQIVLAADNGFYSQTAELHSRGWPTSVSSLRRLPAMLPPRPDSNGEIAKTGLGSSATLVTSLIASLLHRFGALSLPHAVGKVAPGEAELGSRVQGRELEMLHSLAQLAHCAAQGKIGSGFDVCAAVYGSHRYMRFSPAVLQEGLALQEGSAAGDTLLRCVGRVGSGAYGSVPHQTADSSERLVWDHRVDPFELPPGVEVVMADVSCGANTPSMVKKVTTWREADSAAPQLWAAYATASAALQDGLSELCALHLRLSTSSIATGTTGDSWMAAIGRCAMTEPARWVEEGSVGETLAQLRKDCLAARALLREISLRSETPIEPPEQSELLDATMAEAGVLMAVVPGAGGCDAVLALILSPTPHTTYTTPHTAAPGGGDVRKRLETLWAAWADPSESTGEA